MTRLHAVAVRYTRGFILYILTMKLRSSCMHTHTHTHTYTHTHTQTDTYIYCRERESERERERKREKTLQHHYLDET